MACQFAKLELAFRMKSEALPGQRRPMLVVKGTIAKAGDGVPVPPPPQ
jgi:hypothetical protein